MHPQKPIHSITVQVIDILEYVYTPRVYRYNAITTPLAIIIICMLCLYWSCTYLLIFANLQMVGLYSDPEGKSIFEKTSAASNLSTGIMKESGSKFNESETLALRRRIRELEDKVEVCMYYVKINSLCNRINI